MSSATGTTLSKNDLAILGAIFDPEASLTATTHINSQADIPLPSTTEIRSNETIIAKERAAIRHLNTSDPTPEQTRSTISELSILIDENPNYASAYTNRAQATRLLPGSLEDRNHLTSILSDLHTAISLISSAQCSAGNHDRILATAHAHRGYMLLYASSNGTFFMLLRSLSLETMGLPRELSQSQLEELASLDFAIAGKHGDEKARQMAVKTNPYAKLCGSIVREALREEIKVFYEGRSCGDMAVC